MSPRRFFPELCAQNGIVDRLNDVDDLVRALLSLKSTERRNLLGHCGALKMAEQFSWLSIAEGRLRDYQQSIANAAPAA